MKKLGLVVSGDIGCYTLGAVAPLGSVDTTVCMGASVSGALGLAKARGPEFNKKLVSVIGDSTFMHSGITGLVDIVYNKGNNTVIILDNSITGMTGHQDNPTTGYTIRREPTKQTNLISLCKAIGVERVVVADPFDLKHFEEVVKEEVAAEEPSVIIAQRPCALLKTVKYSGHCKIGENCKKCKLCMKLGCPAISEKDGSIVIDATQCNGCGLCVNVCPFGAIHEGGLKMTKNIMIVGVGGQGTLLASRILGNVVIQRGLRRQGFRGARHEPAGRQRCDIREIRRQGLFSDHRSGRSRYYSGF